MVPFEFSLRDGKVTLSIRLESRVSMGQAQGAASDVRRSGTPIAHAFLFNRSYEVGAHGHDSQDHPR